MEAQVKDSGTKSGSSEDNDRSNTTIKRISSRHIILGEVNRLLASMRRNAHWASQNGKSSESPLLKGLKGLRTSLDSSSTVTPRQRRVSEGEIDLQILSDDEVERSNYSYLKPFLIIIRSEETRYISSFVFNKNEKFTNILKR
jgi:hypothetical protein